MIGADQVAVGEAGIVRDTMRDGESATSAPMKPSQPSSACARR